MANIMTPTDFSVLGIKRFLGVNECADGDTNLRVGEASKMRNFRVTNDYGLQKRYGSAVIAGLLNGYSTTEGEEYTLKTEDYASSYSISAYPAITAPDSVGNFDVSGTPVTVTAANASNYIGYYFKDGMTIKKFTGFVDGWSADITGLTAVNDSNGNAAGYVSIASTTADSATWTPNAVGAQTFSAFPSIVVSNGELSVSGNYVSVDASNIASCANYYTSYRSGIYKLSGTYRTEYYLFPPQINFALGYKITLAATKQYIWKAKTVTAGNNTADSIVRAVWSGYVGATPYICAVCNSYLWTLSKTNGVWSKSNVGQITTTGTVHLFGYNDKLYAMDGVGYYSWDGTTFSSVEGYVPCVYTATPPAGGGTAYEQVNKLTAKKSQQFSADGTATVYQLAETGIASVNKVTVGGTEKTLTTDYTVDLATGKVTFTTAPATGINNVKIWWTGASSDRVAFVAMRYAELYNGVNDNRVFVYGDGSNETFYSGIDRNGKATAEYFPDLNVMAVGAKNTPITSIIRHYNKLLIYKRDSTFSAYYGSITLADGNVTAGFYVSPINRNIGNSAPHQAVLVENFPRTVDGRSIYEWKTAPSGSVTGDERNAKRVSQRIETTLKDFKMPDALCYFDKINHEYYCIYNGTAVVQNTTNDTWYVYTMFPAVCMTVFDNDLYYGTADGNLVRFSRDYYSDCGNAIDCLWESGSLDFGRDYKRKNSPCLWVGMKPEYMSAITATVLTDKTDYAGEKSVSETWAVNHEYRPCVFRLRIRAKKFEYYKLKFTTNTADTTATIVTAEVKAREVGYVK